MQFMIVLVLLLCSSHLCFADVIRKTQVIRGQDYTESIYYDGEKEVARVKQSKDGVLASEGEIPDGEVKFIDYYRKTHGEEYYRDGKKHGYSRTFYEDGKLKKETYYLNGQLLMEKEYYTSGVLRFEVDYSDAREMPGNSEVGIGKIYYPDGKLKYEWYFTRTDSRAYKKTYTREGQLRHADYFDEYGKLVGKEDPLSLVSPSAEVAPEGK